MLMVLGKNVSSKRSSCPSPFTSAAVRVMGDSFRVMSWAVRKVPSPLPSSTIKLLVLKGPGGWYRNVRSGMPSLLKSPTATAVASIHDTHGRIEAETLGIVDILVAGQAAINRLTQQGSHSVLGVLPRRASCRPLATVLVNPRASSSSR